MCVEGEWVGEVGRQVGRKKVRKQTPECVGGNAKKWQFGGLTKVFPVIAK